MFCQIRHDLKQKQSPKYLLIAPKSSDVHAQRSVSFGSFHQCEMPQDAACFRRDLFEKVSPSADKVPSSTSSASIMPYISSRNTQEIDPAIFPSHRAQQVAASVAHQQALLAHPFADSARIYSSNCPLAFDMGCRRCSFPPPPLPPLLLSGDCSLSKLETTFWRWGGWGGRGGEQMVCWRSLGRLCMPWQHTVAHRWRKGGREGGRER